MSRNRVVRPSSTRVELSDGDWIELKNELNVGEQRKLEAAGLKPPVMLNGRPFSPIDWAVYELERALIFISAWHITGVGDEVLPLDPASAFSSISSLDVESFEEINAAIIKHTVEQAKAKNLRRTATKEPEQPAENTTKMPEQGSDQISQ